MNAQRFVRQLRREVKTNPKRAALLAVLVAVGIYFWAPLVAGWVMPDDKTVLAAPKKPAASTSPATSNSQNKPNSQAPTPQANAAADTTPWTDLWAAIQSDTRNKPAVGLPATVDPFRPFPVPQELADDSQNTKPGSDKTDDTAKADVARAAATAEVTPKSLGMKLTGTIIGSQGRLAVIDGKVVPEGATITSGTTSTAASADGKSKGKSQPQSKTPRLAFRLVRVEQQSVILERNKKQYTLAIERPQLSGIDFTASATPPR